MKVIHNSSCFKNGRCLLWHKEVTRDMKMHNEQWCGLGELTPPLTGHGGRRPGPVPHPWPWAWQSWPWWQGHRRAGYPLPEGSLSVAQTDPYPGFELAHSNTYPSVTCWSSWRDSSCRTIAAVSPRLKVTARGALVRVQYWWYMRNQSANNSLQWTFASKAVWVTDKLRDTQKLPHHHNYWVCSGGAGKTEEQSGQVPGNWRHDSCVTV